MFYIFASVLSLLIPTLAFLYLREDLYSKWREKCERIQERNNSYKATTPDQLPPKPEFRNALFAVGPIIFLLYTLMESFTVIPAGHIGIQVTFGTVNQQTMHEGAHLINPLSAVRTVDVRLVGTKLEKASASTKDLQQVHTDIVVNYRLSGERVAHIYKEFGLDLEDKIILPAINESFKAVTARFTSEELVVKRDVVSQQIREELATKLGKYNINISEINLVNFGFSVDYQKAIEAKVIATQSKLKAEQDLARIEVEAKQAIARAEGEAKSIQIQTQAINSQGGASYVQLKAIEKWDGKLPTTNAGGTVPFINLK